MATSLGKLFVSIIGDTSGITRSFDKVQAKAEKFGRSMQKTGKRIQSVGTSMSKYISLPLAAAGGAAVTFATKFNEKAKEVQATANLTNQEIEKIKPTIESVAAQTGKSTNDIFDGFQKAVSGSLDFAESQEFIQKAAEASASGFGDMRDLINVATTGFDLFSDTAESAGGVLDSIVHAAGNTQVEVRNLANAFSRGATLANNLGMSQEDLLAILTTVSERFGDTNRGGRATAAMLNLLQKPSKQAADNIEQVYGSMDKFHKQLSKDSLGTLKELKIRLNENNMGLEDVITSNNALNAAQALLSDNGERASEVLERQANKAGAVAKAFENSASFGRKLKQAGHSIMNAMRPLGDVLIERLEPVLDKIIENAQKLSDWFANLDKKTQDLIVTVSLIAAAAGPVIAAIGTLTVALGGAVIGISALISPVTLVVGALAGLAAAFITAYVKSETFRDKVDSVLSKVKNIATGFINKIKNLFNTLWNKTKELWPKIKDKIVGIWEAAIRLVTPIIEAFKDSFQDLYENADSIWEKLKESLNTLIPVLERLWRDIVKPILILIGGAFTTLLGVAIGAINGIISGLDPFIKALLGLVDIVSNVVGLILAIFKGDWKAAWGYMKGIATGAWTVIKNTFLTLYEFIEGFVKGIIGFFEGLYDALVGNSIIPELVNKIVGFFDSLWKDVKVIVSGLIDDIVNFFKKKLFSGITKWMGKIKDKIVGGWKAIKSIVVGNSIVPDMNDAIVASFDQMKKDLKDIAGSIWDTIETVFRNGIEIINTITGGMVDDIVNFFKKKLFSGITKWMGKIKDKIVGGWKAIKNIVVGNSIVPDMNDLIIKEFQRMKKQTDKEIEQTKKNIKDGFNTIKSESKALMDSTVETTKMKMVEMEEDTKEQTNKMQTDWSNMWDSVEGTMSRALKNIIDSNMTAGESLERIWDATVEEISTKIGEISGETFSQEFSQMLGTGIGGLFGGVAGAGIGAFTAVKLQDLFGWGDEKEDFSDRIERATEKYKDFASMVNRWVEKGRWEKMLWLSPETLSDEETFELIGDELEYLTGKYGEMVERTKDIFSGIQSNLKSAFSADTYKGFLNKFADGLESTVKSSLITSFMESNAVKSLMDDLTAKIFDVTKNWRNITQSDMQDIRNIYGKVTNRARGLYGVLEELGADFQNMFPSEDETKEFGNNISQTVLDITDVISDRLQNIIKSVKGLVKSAFSADTYSGFLKSFGSKLKDTIQSNLLQSFLESSAMKPLMDRLAGQVARATEDWTDFRGADLNRIKQTYEQIAEMARFFYNQLDFHGITSADFFNPVANTSSSISQSLATSGGSQQQTANIYLQLDGETLASALEQPLTDKIEISAG